MARKAGASSPNAGLDRNRIGERLEASVAGLQELRLLRERQEETVRRVLAGQEEEEEGDGGGSHGQRVPGGLRPARAAGSEQSLSRGPEELEAHQLHRRVPEIYLGSIGQRHAYPDPGAPNSDLAPAANLSRPEAAGGPGGAPRGGSSGTPAEGAVRVCPSPARPGASPPASLAAEDPRGMAPVPGKERLFSASAGPAETTPGPQETDRGSGELKRLGSGMQLVDGPLDSPDSDSRPSSGFYDVSDSTSCSLSNSCTSVYSECPSGSRWSMQSLSQLPRASGNWSRPRSTDEATVRLMDLRAQRLPGGLGARASDGCVVSGAHRRSKVSQRPVSTGDLNFLRRYLSIEPVGGHVSRCCGGPEGPDPKYRCDLVSRNSNEVYHYPSPLHAVALQSPLFTALSGRRSPWKEEMGGEGETEASGGGQGVRMAGVPPEASQTRLDRYIGGLVLRFRCQPAGGARSLSAASLYSRGSSAKGGVAAALQPPPGGWKVRRRISTCCQAAEGASCSSLEAACRLSGPPVNAGASVSPDDDDDAHAVEGGLLYRGKHLHRELVRCPSREADVFRRPAKVGGGGRCSSEINLHSLSPSHRPEASGLELRPSPAKRKHKWTSVLEIPRCSNSRPKKPGFLAFLSRHHQPAAAAALQSSREDLQAYRCHGDGRWAPAPRLAETLPRPAVAMESRFHRSKSFKELRKKVQMSIRPWSLKVNTNTVK